MCVCVCTVSIDLYLHFIVFVHPQTVKRVKPPANAMSISVQYRCHSILFSHFRPHQQKCHHISSKLMITQTRWANEQTEWVWQWERDRNFIISLRWLESKISLYPLCVCAFCSFVKNCDWLPASTDTYHTRYTVSTPWKMIKQNDENDRGEAKESERTKLNASTDLCCNWWGIFSSCWFTCRWQHAHIFCVCNRIDSVYYLDEEGSQIMKGKNIILLLYNASVQMMKQDETKRKIMLLAAMSIRRIHVEWMIRVYSNGFPFKCSPTLPRSFLCVCIS